MARMIGYWEYDRDEVLTCPECGWSGRAGSHAEYRGRVLDVICSDCDKMFLIIRAEVEIDETREAAAAGNEEAQRMLPKMEAAIAETK